MTKHEFLKSLGKDALEAASTKTWYAFQYCPSAKLFQDVTDMMTALQDLRNDAAAAREAKAVRS